jgi:hypothetical protein
VLKVNFLSNLKILKLLVTLMSAVITGPLISRISLIIPNGEKNFLKVCLLKKFAVKAVSFLKNYAVNNGAEVM